MVRDFFDTKNIAVAGASRNPKKFGNIVCRELIRKGYHIYPVNPSNEPVCGIASVKEVKDLPAEVQHLLIVTPANASEKVMQAAIDKGIKNVWVQQMSDTPATLELARKASINLFHGACVFMYAEPVDGMHKFHRGLKKFFKTYKE